MNLNDCFIIRQVWHKKIRDGNSTWRVKRQFYFRKKLIERFFFLNGSFKWEIFYEHERLWEIVMQESKKDDVEEKVVWDKNNKITIIVI
jgi:hypothetical protein